MGIFKPLFGKRTKKKGHDIHGIPSQKPINPAPVRQANVRRGETKWKRSEECDRDVVNGFCAWNDSSLQGTLHAIKYSTIIAHIAKVSDTITPVRFEDRGDDFLALADDDGYFLASIDKRYVLYSGHKEGDEAECAVMHIDYKGEDIVNLYLLKTQFAIDHEDEIREMETMSRKFDAKLPFGLEYIDLNVHEDDMAAPLHHEGKMLHSCITRLLPVTDGSSAKPNIMITLDGVDAAEVPAKYLIYESLLRHIGEPTVACMTTRYKSSGRKGGYYYKLIFAYR